MILLLTNTKFAFVIACDKDLTDPVPRGGLAMEFMSGLVTSV